jgi:hypothetical protein
MLILVSIVSWTILTLLRVGVHLFLANGLGIKRANGHWLYLTPQIILITIYSYAVVTVFQGFDKESLLVLGAIWLVLVLCFEFIGVLVIQKKSFDELFGRTATAASKRQTGFPRFAGRSHTRLRWAH